MPTRGKQPDFLVDTSVAVALVLADHEHHLQTVRSIGRHRLGLAGHAAFETFSVLTRLPPPARRSPNVVSRLLHENFPESRYLSPQRADELIELLGNVGIAGGSVYDALVGATAIEHRVKLATRDQRALATYRALQVDVELLLSEDLGGAG
ncbi:MAG TPA: type II toxin-antitoxin system VapC family toxin [Candidatus Micrarchaeaceae archaeon]|nr:type II toxin-antitoxin system VapC family toxin [Candidatus Micrarchaeaceae archaeon]